MPTDAARRPTVNSPGALKTPPTENTGVGVALGAQEFQAPLLDRDLPIEARPGRRWTRRQRERAVVAAARAPIGQLAGDGERLLRRQVQHGVEARLRRDASAARQLEIGFGARDAEVGLQHFEPRRGAGVEARLRARRARAARCRARSRRAAPARRRDERVERLRAARAGRARTRPARRRRPASALPFAEFDPPPAHAAQRKREVERQVLVGRVLA